MTVRGGMWILDRVERRMAKAHFGPDHARPSGSRGTFAAVCSPYKIILLFFIGAFWAISPRPFSAASRAASG